VIDKLLRITVRPDAFRYPAELAERVNPRLGSELEARIRSRTDPVVSGMGRTKTLRVAAKGNALVIEPMTDEVTPAAAGIREGGSPMAQEISSIEDLFSPSEAPLRFAGSHALDDLRKHEEVAFIDGQMRQVLEFEFPHLLEAAVKELQSSNPSWAMVEERLR
jgi:hypothetical protein